MEKRIPTSEIQTERQFLPMVKGFVEQLLLAISNPKRAREAARILGDIECQWLLERGDRISVRHQWIEGHCKPGCSADNAASYIVVAGPFINGVTIYYTIHPEGHESESPLTVLRFDGENWKPIPGLILNKCS